MKELNLEKALTDLETMVAQLEKGDLSLDKSIKVYEKGINLIGFCNEELGKAKLKIEELKEPKKDEAANV